MKSMQQHKKGFVDSDDPRLIFKKDPYVTIFGLYDPSNDGWWAYAVLDSYGNLAFESDFVYESAEEAEQFALEWYEEFGDKLASANMRRAKGKVVTMKMDERKAFDAGFEAGMKSVKKGGARQFNRKTVNCKAASSLVPPVDLGKWYWDSDDEVECYTWAPEGHEGDVWFQIDNALGYWSWCIDWAGPYPPNIEPENKSTCAYNALADCINWANSHVRELEELFDES